MKHLPLDWRTLSAIAAAALAVMVAIYWWRRRPPTADEIERRRRSHVNQVGRIVEGQVVELVHAPAATGEPANGGRFFRRKNPAAPHAAVNGGRKLVCYSYSISGVRYETAQDITGLEARVSLDRLVAGQPASVKYDPANPGNSILVADDWSGLR